MPDDDWSPTPEESERSQELLAELGLATFNAQAVEYGLVSLLAAAAIRDGAELASETVRTVMDTGFSRTMGRLLKEVTRSVDFSAERLQVLQAAWQARNWLTHHFYRQFAPAAEDESSRRQALTLLRHARRIFEVAHQELHNEILRLLDESGISREQAAAGANAALERFVQSDMDPRVAWYVVEEIERLSAEPARSFTP